MVGYNVDISGNYVNNTVENGGVLYILYCVDNSIIHDSIFINNNIGDEPIITVLMESISASNNWFGNNATDYNITPNVSQNLTLINWLFLNATANPDELELNQSSTITFKLYSYDAASGTTSEFDASKMNISLDLTQTIGELNHKTALLGDEITYTARQTGNASVTGKLGNVSYTIYLKNNGLPTEINVTNSTLDLKVNDTFDLVATTAPEGLAVTYNSSNMSVATVDANGKVVAVGAGSAVITLSVGGDGVYALNSTTVAVNVVKRDLNISAYSFNMGENVTLIVVGFENVTRNVTIAVGENNYNASIMWGMAFVTIPQVAEIITAYIDYPGDDNYCNASTTIEIIAKKNLNITIGADPIHVGENATVIITGLESAAGNVSVIAGDSFKNATIINGTATATISGLNQTTTIYAKVTVNLNGAKTYTTDKNGQVKINVAKLVPKSYTAKITFVKVTVKKANPKLTAKSKTFKLKVKVKKYSIVLKTNKNKALKKVKVTLRVKGKTYSAKTNSKGKAVFNIKNLKKKRQIQQQSPMPETNTTKK